MSSRFCRHRLSLAQRVSRKQNWTHDVRESVMSYFFLKIIDKGGRFI